MKKLIYENLEKILKDYTIINIQYNRTRMSSITPISFVKPNTRVEVYFADGGWYAGKIEKVNERNDEFVYADILYDDGERDEDVKLENEHFEAESEDAWRLEGDLSMLIKAVLDTNNEVEDLKSDVECMQEELVELMCDSDDDYDDSAYETSDTESEQAESTVENVRDYSSLKWYTVGLFFGSTLGLLIGTLPQISQYTCPMEIPV